MPYFFHFQKEYGQVYVPPTVEAQGIAVQRVSNMMPSAADADHASFLYRIKQEPCDEASTAHEKSDTENVKDSQQFSNLHHKSVISIIQEYPNIILPSSVLNSNVNPEVWLETSDVDRYIKKRQRALKLEKKKLAEIEKERKRRSSPTAVESSRPQKSIIYQKEEQTQFTSSLLNIPVGVAAKVNGVIIKKVPITGYTVSNIVSRPASSAENDISAVDKSPSPSPHAYRGYTKASVQRSNYDTHHTTLNGRTESPTHKHRQNKSSKDITIEKSDSGKNLDANFDGQTESSIHKNSQNKSTKDIIERRDSDKHLVANLKRKKRGKPKSKRKRIIDSDDSDDEDFHDEIIPQKKDRSSIKRIQLPKKLELTLDTFSDLESTKQVFTSSLELTPSLSRANPSHENNTKDLLSRSGKTENVFICSVCQLIFDTKRELSQHSKTHLTCKFCKTKVRNVSDLHDHLGTTCFIAIEANPPDLKLHRIDEVPSVVDRYREVFEEFRAQYVNSESSKSDRTLIPKHESLENESHENHLTLRKLLDDGKKNIRRHVEKFKEVTVPLKSEQMLTTSVEDAEVVNISDDDIEDTTDVHGTVISDDDDVTPPPDSDLPVQETPMEEAPIEVRIENAATMEEDPLAIKEPEPMESVSVVRPRINKISAQKVPNIFYRDKVIQLLFSKYANLHKVGQSVDQSTDPYVPCDSDIHMDNNIIRFKGLFRDLVHAKTPVYFKQDEKISASFVPRRDDRTVPRNVKWPHEMAVKIVNKASKSRAGKIQISSNAIVMEPTTSVANKPNKKAIETGPPPCWYIAKLPRIMPKSGSPPVYQGANSTNMTLPQYPPPPPYPRSTDQPMVSVIKAATKTVDARPVSASPSQLNMKVVSVVNGSNCRLLSSSPQSITTSMIANTNNSMYSPSPVFNSASVAVPNQIYSGSGSISISNQMFNPVVSTYPMISSNQSFVVNQSSTTQASIAGNTYHGAANVFNTGSNAVFSANPAVSSGQAQIAGGTFNQSTTVSTSVFGGNQTASNGLFNASTTSNTFAAGQVLGVNHVFGQNQQFANNASATSGILPPSGNICNALTMNIPTTAVDTTSAHPGFLWVKDISELTKNVL